MKTRILRVVNELEKEKIKEAAKIIAEGGLVAFPTETVYGLGADGKSPLAAQKIYEAKGRPSDNPLIVHIAQIEQLEDWGKDIPESAYKLAERFWPGPLTMVVKKQPSVPLETTGGLPTVALRMPRNEIALELIRESGCAIAAPSANTSGRPSPTKAKHVIEDLDGKIDMIIDGGTVGIGLESTIVDLTEEKIMILRPGAITKEMLEEVVEEVVVDPGLLETNAIEKPKAPGMKYRHYAPKGDLTIVHGSKGAVVEKINQLVTMQQSQGKKAAVIGTSETLEEYQGDVILSIGSRENEMEIAANLYDYLRKLDEEKVDVIYSESFHTPKMGQAIMNRLLKAAGHKIIEVEDK